MQLLDHLQDKAWAMRPSKLEEINAFLNSRLNSVEMLEARPDPIDPRIDLRAEMVGRSGNKADQSYQVKDRTAIIPVFGVIEKRMNLMSNISGGTSCELIQRDIAAALKDSAVDSILLDVESPGGSVDGPKALADFIFESRGKKPIVAYANGMMCSAAYWIASACDAIVANDTAIVGSIGVAMTHHETSAQDATRGIKRTEIYAGKYKRIASSTKPLTEDGQAYLQSMVDTYYGLFIDAISRNRSVSEEKALSMADGREFIGNQALEAGLVDSIGSMDVALGLAKKRSVQRMDLKMLQEQHPDLFAQVKAMGREEFGADLEKAKATAMAEGVNAERARVAEILEANGDQKITLEAITTGIPAAETYKRLFTAEREMRAEGLGKLKERSKLSVGTEASKDNTSKTFESEIERLVVEGKTRGEATRAVIENEPKLHEDFLARSAKK